MNLVLLVAGASMLLATFDAAAELCCPAGCVQNGNGGCVSTGAAPHVCGKVTCSGGNVGSGGGGGGGGGTTPRGQGPVTPTCSATGATAAADASVAAKCVAALTANAQLLGCLLEDDAGKREDKRTGLTCAQREAALAKQCASRCETFAHLSVDNYCPYEGYTERMWQIAFGDLAGPAVGFARVDGCGPPLRSKLDFGHPGRTRHM
jgi:hypothetical protein